MGTERGTADRPVRHLLGSHVCFVAVIARAEKYVEPMRQPGVGETALNRSHSSSEMWSQPCNQRISLFLYSIDRGKSSRDERCGRAPIERSLAPSQTLKIEWASIRPNRARLEQPRASDYDEFAGVGGEIVFPPIGTKCALSSALYYGSIPNHHYCIDPDIPLAWGIELKKPCPSIMMAVEQIDSAGLSMY